MTRLFKHKEGTKYKTFHCPLCNIDIQEMDSLRLAIPQEKTLWIANMITHYRYGHISSWNNLLRKKKRMERKRGYRQDYLMNTEEQMQEVTERAKRQIIRGCYSYMREHEIKGADFRLFEKNEPATLELAHKMLDGQLTLF